jgi:hypothetical protein
MELVPRHPLQLVVDGREERVGRAGLVGSVVGGYRNPR